jgi:hypothetical protein
VEIMLALVCLKRYTVPNQNVYFPDFFIYYNVGTAYDLNGTNTGNLPSGLCRYKA